MQARITAADASATASRPNITTSLSGLSATQATSRKTPATTPAALTVSRTGPGMAMRMVMRGS